MPEPSPSLAELLALTWRLCTAVWGRVPVRIGFDWDGQRGRGEPVSWFPLAGVRAEATPAAPATPPADEQFVCSPFQLGILEALDGRALRTDGLGAAVGDRGRLFKHPGGLKELQARGLVAHHSRLGFYRPDAPPEQLRQAPEP